MLFPYFNIRESLILLQNFKNSNFFDTSRTMILLKNDKKIFLSPYINREALTNYATQATVFVFHSYIVTNVSLLSSFLEDVVSCFNVWEFLIQLHIIISGLRHIFSRSSKKSFVWTNRNIWNFRNSVIQLCIFIYLYFITLMHNNCTSFFDIYMYRVQP